MLNLSEYLSKDKKKVIYTYDEQWWLVSPNSVLTTWIFHLLFPIAPGSPVRWQRVFAGALPKLHEVHLSAALQQLGPFHLLSLHLVPANSPHCGPALPVPCGLHGRLLWDRDQPVLLQPLPERRRVCPQRGRLHLHLPGRVHRWGGWCVCCCEDGIHMLIIDYRTSKM